MCLTRYTGRKYSRNIQQNYNFKLRKKSKYPNSSPPLPLPLPDPSSIGAVSLIAGEKNVFFFFHFPLFKFFCASFFDQHMSAAFALCAF